MSANKSSFIFGPRPDRDVMIQPVRLIAAFSIGELTPIIALNSRKRGADFRETLGSIRLDQI